MAEEINGEPEFSEDVDRLLSGREVEAGADAAEDYRTALQFARKLKGLGDEPSPVFKTRLRGELLSQLAGREAKSRPEKRVSFRGFLGRLVAGNPVWRTATATLVVAVLCALVFWRVGLFLPAAEEAPPAAVVPAPQVTPSPMPAAPPKEAAEGSLDAGDVLRLEVVLAGTNAFAAGDEVSIDLVFRNTGPGPLVVAPFPPAVWISRVDTDAVVRYFAPGSGSGEVPASGTLSYTLVWDQMDEYIEPVAPGRYLIMAGDVTLQEGGREPANWAGPGAVAEIIITPR